MVVKCDITSPYHLLTAILVATLTPDAWVGKWRESQVRSAGVLWGMGETLGDLVPDFWGCCNVVRAQGG